MGELIGLVGKPPSLRNVYGNAEVIEFLEKWLKAAKLGNINYVALTATLPPDIAINDFAGSIEGEENVLEAIIEGLVPLIRESLAKKEPPPQDDELNASYLSYPVTKLSVGFDFIFSLVAQKMVCKREGIAGPVRIGFWAGKSGTMGVEGGYRKGMFDNVVKPLLPMFGVLEDERAIYGHRFHKYDFRLREIVEASLAGEKVPTYIPSAAAMNAVNETVGPEDPIVITLRESDAWSHRNTNNDAWIAFAKDREREGYPVVFVRDTAKYSEPLANMATYPAASLSLPIRAALYERARVNFFVGNGPCDLALFGSRPWIRIQRYDKGSQHEVENERWWKAIGLEPGTQMPWCSDEQRIILGTDDYRTISQAWEELTRPRILS